MRELPLVFPPIETYQGSAFVLGIFLAYSDYEDLQYNGYINLQYRKGAPNLGWLAPSFINSMWDDYRLEGLGEMNMYDICNFTETSLVNFMHERLDQDCYLLLYDVDEYYLSNGEKYQREHFNHDTYIYGYTDDSFLVLAYTGEHLKRLAIPNQEVVDSLFSKEARKNLDQRRHFSSFRPVIGKSVKADVGLIRNAIKEFYEPDEEENPDEEIGKGFGVYDEIIRCLESLQEEERVDLRAIRVIWEQKELMVKRIKKVFPGLPGNCAGAMQEISDRVRLIFKLVMKYNLSCKRSVAERACQMLKDVRDDDLKWYETFLKEYKVFDIA